MDPWYKVTLPREKAREARSFNPAEFTIHLEQAISKTAPEDYRDPQQFFSRTCFTRALREHAGILLQAGGAGKRPQGTHQGRARAWSGISPPRQRPFGTLPDRQRGEASAGCYAVGGT